MQLIRRGDRGQHVLDVQQRLARLGYVVPADERSTFGEQTASALRAFQQARGILVDGIVGKDTWSELVEASWHLGDRVLYLRAPHFHGDDVRALQDTLGTFGFDCGRIDGIHGPRTDAAIRDFQRNYGLPTDGVVGERTVRALRGLPRLAGDTPAVGIREREAIRARALSVAGMRVVLDPGHGGDDAGHIGATGAREDQICYAIAHRAEARLVAAGAQVFVARRAEDAPTESERAALANALEGDIFVSIHLGGGEPGTRGSSAFYFGHERFHSEAGAQLAELLLEEICALGFVDGRSHAKTFPVLRETRMPAVLVEVGTLTDPEDEKLLADPAVQARAADAVAEAVRRFTQIAAAV
ncbi:MAG: N-acetylmuramoyl-L-alanine amidase [Actinomycetota bacterium]|nr:N-acetylmuramoyl-L-alanine amidase [Actinomycetota bacterium]